MAKRRPQRLRAIGRALASLKLTTVLLLLLALVVLAGTAWQAEHGLYAAQRDVFSAWLFLAFGFVPLPGLLAVALLLGINLAAALAFRLPWRLQGAGLLLLHGGLLLLVGGGFFAAAVAREYSLILREGGSADALVLADGSPGPRLPFAVRLLDFQKSFHPGTEIPRRFASRVELRSAGGRRQAVIAMNRPLRAGGYTFYQSAHEEDERGETSILAVVRNSGRWLPYIASALIFLGLAWHCLARIVAARARPGREKRP